MKWISLACVLMMITFFASTNVQAQDLTALETYFQSEVTYDHDSGFGATGWVALPYVNLAPDVVFLGVGPKIGSSKKWSVDLTFGAGMFGSEGFFILDFHGRTEPYLRPLGLPLFSYLNIEWADPRGDLENLYVYFMLNYALFDGLVMPGFETEDIFQKGVDQRDYGPQIAVPVGDKFLLTFSYTWHDGAFLDLPQGPEHLFRLRAFFLY